jgi:uncharacterized iron-regulated membrane protein
MLHKWSSLVCAAFLLMCVTSLPLIFHDEIDGLTEQRGALRTVAAGTPLKSLDEMMRIALASRPGAVGLFMSFDEDRPVVNITTGPRPDVGADQMLVRSFDQRTGQLVGAIQEGRGVMGFLLKLHMDMFLGLPGMLFLGLMGLLFVLAIVSGVALYAPFMRKLDFGTLRVQRSARTKWLDYHNLLGIVALAWAMLRSRT